MRACVVFMIPITDSNVKSNDSTVKPSDLCVRAVVCVQAVGVGLRLYRPRLLGGGGGPGSAAGRDVSPVTARGPCAAPEQKSLHILRQHAHGERASLVGVGYSVTLVIQRPYLHKPKRLWF